MLEAVRRLVDEVVLPSVERWDRDDELPAEVLERLGELGVPGALVPEQYGGRALPVSAMVDVWRTATGSGSGRWPRS
jgi:alkylation response protein AidB-like acyl-CoA dehydrogenase